MGDEFDRTPVHNVVCVSSVVRCRGVQSLKSMMYVAHFPPTSAQFINVSLFPLNFSSFPYFRSIYGLLNLRFLAFPLFLTIMHLCIMLDMYWTPLVRWICNPAIVASHLLSRTWALSHFQMFNALTKLSKCF